MTVKRTSWFFVSILVAALLVGCSAGDNVVFKALAGEKPGEKGSVPDAIAMGPLTTTQPALGRTRFRKQASNKKPPAAKGTNDARLRAAHAGLKIRIFGHDDELERVRRSISLHYAAYNKAVAGFGLRKKKSLPRNDAAYRANMAEARSRLARVNGDLLKLNTVAAKVSADVAEAGALLKQVRAGKAAGQASAALETDVSGTVSTVHRMLAEIQLDISKQAAYASSQSSGLDQLAKTVAAEAPAGNTPTTGARNKPSGVTAAAAAPAKRPRSTRPLVRIRFATPKVAYEAPLYEALKAALAKRPGLEFEVIGVARTAERQGSALGNAQQVMFSMAEMGVPPARVTVSAATNPSVTADEVHLYVK